MNPRFVGCQILFSGLPHVKDDAHTVSMYQKALCALVPATFPMLLLLVLLGEGLVVNLYGEKWADAAFPVQVMAIGVFASVTLGVLADFIRGVGGAALSVYGIVGLGCAGLTTGNEAITAILETSDKGACRLLLRGRRSAAGEGSL